MFRRIGLTMSLILLIPILILGDAALAQGGVIVQHSDPHWEAAYWNNTSLWGTPVLQRRENQLNYHWGLDAPHPTVAIDNFSARWTRYIDVTPGTYRFTATTDDGIRVWVDSDLIINQWHDQPLTTYTARKYLGAGHHFVKVEYYEHLGVAVAKVSWTQVPDTIQHWRGEYYNNKTLSGVPTVVRDDAEINFSWGGGSPAPGQIDTDVFSVRWTRNLNLPAGNYRFTMTVDDGARLYVNGHLLIDAWKDQPPHTYTGDIYLRGGSATVQMEYYENRGGATAHLTWSPTDSSPSVTISPTSGPSGTLVQVVATGFPPNTPVSVGLGPKDSQFTEVARGTTDAHGRFTVQVPVHGAVGMDWIFAVATDGTHVTSTPFHIVGDTPIGAVIVDDTDTAFVRHGSTTGWRTAPEGYGGRLTWTRNNDWIRPRYNWARWYPDLVAGRYEVFAYIPDRYTTTSQARYWVSHRDGHTLRVLDQSANGDRWVSLGTYWFRGTRDDSVSLSDVTYEPHLSRLIAFDAIRWEPR